MNKKSLVAEWISQCEKIRKATCENTICDKCKFNNVCIKLMRIDPVFKISGYKK